LKVAGLLALLLAIAIGTWTLWDYLKNDAYRQSNQTALEFEAKMNALKQGAVDPPSHTAELRAKEIEDAVRYDAEMGIVASVIFIGAIVLLSARTKPAD